MTSIKPPGRCFLRVRIQLPRSHFSVAAHQRIIGACRKWNPEFHGLANLPVVVGKSRKEGWIPTWRLLRQGFATHDSTT